MDGLIGLTAEKRRLHVLDGLRGMAAIMVVFFHFRTFVAPINVDSAYLAVDLFFVISGIVMDRSYRAKLDTTLKPRRFMFIRFTRLYPLYFIGTLVAAIVPVVGLILGISRLWSWGALLPTVGLGLLMIPTPPIHAIGNHLYPLNTPAWSLFYELAANLLFATIPALRRPRTLRILLPFLAVVIAATSFLHGSLGAGWTWPDLPIALIRVLFSFFLGVAIHQLYLSDRLPKFPLPPLLALLLVIPVLLWDPSVRTRAAYDAICVILILPLITWVCLCSVSVRATGLCSFLGLISYPIYVIHEPLHYGVDRIIDRVFHGHATDFAPWIGLSLTAALVAISWALAEYYDARARQVLGRVLGVRQGAVP